MVQKPSCQTFVVNQFYVLHLFEEARNGKTRAALVVPTYGSFEGTHFVHWLWFFRVGYPGRALPKFLAIHLVTVASIPWRPLQKTEEEDRQTEEKVAFASLALIYKT